MKKITLLAAVIAVASFASCKKAYTCACTTTVTSPNYLGTGTTTNVYNDDAAAYGKKMNKKTAQSACDAEKASMEQTFKNAETSNGQYTSTSVSTVDCTLK